MLGSLFEIINDKDVEVVHVEFTLIIERPSAEAQQVHTSLQTEKSLR